VGAKKGGYPGCGLLKKVSQSGIQRKTGWLLLYIKELRSEARNGGFQQGKQCLARFILNLKGGEKKDSKKDNIAK